MPERYVDQAVFSRSEAEHFFRTYGLHIDHWPQVIPSTAMIEAYKKEVELNAKLVKEATDEEAAGRFANEALAAAEDPERLIRTPWGALVAIKFLPQEEIPGFFSVDIHVEPQWRSRDLTAVKRALENLLSVQSKRFNAMLRAAGAPRGIHICIGEGINGAVASVNSYYKYSRNGKYESNACDAISGFFAWQYKIGALDQIIDNISNSRRTG